MRVLCGVGETEGPPNTRSVASAVVIRISTGNPLAIVHGTVSLASSTTHARCCNARIRVRNNFISFAFGLSNDERMSWKIL